MLGTKNERERGEWRTGDGAGSRRGRGFHRPSAIRHLRVLLPLALAVFLAGCGPPGPRALLAGKKLLGRGDYAGAVAELKTATTLLATNAAAWNYYGVALQHAGQAADAAQAYANALKYDRDLVEAHYNLGCLWLEQGRFADAKSEFTAYTLRRNNSPEGWNKLGAAQLNLREIPLAEKSFSTAFYLNTNNAEALNGLGLASVQRGQPDNAARFFAAAVRFHPDYAPALLNLATVEWQYLHDPAAALNNYHAYLALKPRPADWDAVNDLVNSLQQPAASAASPTPPAPETEAVASAKPAVVETRPPPRPAARPVQPPRNGGSPLLAPRQRGAEVATAPAEQGREPVRPASPPEHRVSPERPVQPAGSESPGVFAQSNPVQRSAALMAVASVSQSGVTPLASNHSQLAFTRPPPAAAAPVKLVTPAPPVFPRYLYLSPAKPRPGDRKAAMVAFAAGQTAEKSRDLAAAMNSYRQAAELDPSWFDAQYDYAVLAYEEKDYRRALTASEMALALQPGSVDARYGFALTLKAAGYVTDAINELRKIVAAHPDEARAQLALGNLYAQQLRDPELARPHYLKWLELDPHDPQAINIRFWLSQHPP